MKYHTIFENQWQNIYNDINSLNPTDEDEIVKIVVKGINSYPDIYRHVESKVYLHDNIRYYKIKRHDKFKSNTHCIFIGIKILSDSSNKQELLDESEEIILFLYNKYSEGTSVRNKLIIYDKTNTITDNDIEKLKDFQDTHRVKIHLC